MPLIHISQTNSNGVLAGGALVNDKNHSVGRLKVNFCMHNSIAFFSIGGKIQIVIMMLGHGQGARLTQHQHHPAFL